MQILWLLTKEPLRKVTDLVHEDWGGSLCERTILLCASEFVLRGSNYFKSSEIKPPHNKCPKQKDIKFVLTSLKSI